MSPRQILRRQLERAAERGLRVCSATELEFFLFKDSYEEASAKGWKGLTPHTSTIEDYQLLQTAREEYILRRIRNEMRAAGIPVEFSKGEAGRGQHEVNVTYDEALATADRHLVFKNGIKEIAGAGGPGRHVHGQVDDGRRRARRATCTPACGTPRAANRSWPPRRTDGSHPSGLSTVGRRFLAGQLHAARELAWLPRPTSTPTAATSPGSWAPTAGGLRRGQPHLRLPPRRATGRDAGWSRGSRGPT